ncbi:MAG: TonB-dependent receptor, partial [Betaproteobacteria bacterium]
DGVPIRATGMFNHNALYEIDIPMAGGIEVTRGPGTALYGSDAIGGIINVLTRAPSAAPDASVSLEGGSFGWGRLLGSASTGMTRFGGLRADLNLTHSDGWRAQTAYDRQSANLRWDYEMGPRTSVKTVLAYANIDQETGANSPLILADFQNNPTKNNFAIAFRKVNALRLSTALEREIDNGLLSLTAYLRDNSMELNGSYNLSFDPRIENSANTSFGLMAKWRQDFPDLLRGRLIVGVDLDRSPGSRTEDNLIVSRTGTGADTSFNSFTLGTRIYDYDVTYKSVSPYLHTEFSPLDRLRLNVGVRYDAIGYDMTNQLASGAVQATVNGASRFYGQLAGASVDYTQLSPKFGATFAIDPDTSVYASWNHGFRVPSESQLFRAGNDTTPLRALNRANVTLGLKPIQASQFEVGVRGRIRSVAYNVVLYDLIKYDDLVSQRDLATNVTTNVNAGKTESRGLEIGLGAPLSGSWRVDLAASYAIHRYVNYVTATADFSGKEIEAAPRLIGNTRLSWTPTEKTLVALEWVRVGSYWLEASNAAAFGKYSGYDLFNLRVNHALNKTVSVFARIMNLLDERFADSASVTSNTPVFSPGLPRACYAGIEARW